MPVVIPERCPQNHPCPLVKVCPVGAIRQQGFAAPVIDAEKCIQCGACPTQCGKGAVRDDEGANELAAPFYGRMA